MIVRRQLGQCGRWCATLALVWLLGIGHAELRDFDLLLEHTSLSINYVEFYLRGPGTIDLSRLSIQTVERGADMTNSSTVKNDDMMDDDLADDTVDDGLDDDHDDALDDATDGDDFTDDNEDDDFTDDQGGSRRLDTTTTPSSFIDIVIFRLPKGCASTRKGCDWTDLGVGAKTSAGEVRWCCSAEAQSLKLCTGGQQQGRLITKPNAVIDRRALEIPASGAFAGKLDNAVIPEQESGEYVIVIANCNDESGRRLAVEGTAAFKSVHGYLPGELYGFLLFYTVLTFVYFVVLVWYAALMHKHEESRIPIENWILLTIILGSVEMLFKAGDAFVWNLDGYQETWIAFFGILVGVLKRGISRCLIVMVSLGWGVTRGDLGSKLKWIVFLGILYVCFSAVRDLLIVVAVEGVQELSDSVESGLFDLYTIFSFLVAAVDVAFVLWILDALSCTMEYLEGLHQTRKLLRYLRLRCLFLFAVLFATAWILFSIVNSYAVGIMEEENAWIVDAATEVNYLVVLIGVAIMWRPNPAAKDYAYAMELSPNGDDDNCVTELELSGAIPSASDDYDDDDYDGVNPPGYDSSPRSNGKFSDSPRFA